MDTEDVIKRDDLEVVWDSQRNQYLLNIPTQYPIPSELVEDLFKKYEITENLFTIYNISTDLDSRDRLFDKLVELSREVLELVEAGKDLEKYLKDHLPPVMISDGTVMEVVEWKL